MKADRMTSGALLTGQELQLLASLFLCELSIGVITAAMDMKGERLFAVFLASKSGMAFLCAIVTFFLCGRIIAHKYLENRRSRFHRFGLIVMMNLITVTLTIAIGEFMVRAGSYHYRDGEAFANRLLLPKNWETRKLRYRRAVEQADGHLSYMIYDDLLGWTVGPEKRSANGLYFSNSDGIRTPHQGMSLLKSEKRTEIALVGDSFTFGLAVRYEESWGYHLGQMLGEKFQVLNYGVPGYGVGQTYLRYEKDASRRKPKVVLFGLISHDLFRTMWVYPFLATRWDVLFSNPRFVLRDGKLTTINVPTFSPDEILSRSSPSDLPFIEYQPGYRENEWRRNSLHFSYLYRLFSSIYSEWQPDHPLAVTDELVSVNRAIIQAFVRSAREAGSTPVLVYFPSKGDFLNTSTPAIGKRVLQEAGVPFLDPTPCLLEVNPADRFLEDHYSPSSNAAVAKCLYSALSKVLEQTSANSHE